MSKLNTLAESFLSSYNGTIRAFPPSFRQVYTHQMEAFRLNEETKGFEQITTKDGFEDFTLKGVAHRMYWWFPPHFFKFQDALLRWEDNWQKQRKSFLLNKFQVTFVDLGCGAGAASVALLSILEQYQIFLEQHGVRTEPIVVNLIALDPIQRELDVYESVVSSYLLKLRLRKITGSITTLCQPFPQGKEAIIKALELRKGSNLIVGMSNLINWIWNEADIYWETNETKALDEIQPEEANALREIAIGSNFDTLYVIGIATKNKQRGWLADKLSTFLRSLISILRLSKRPFGTTWKIDAEVLFENPEGSRWAKERAQGTSRYFVENIIDIDPEFYSDSKLHKVLSFDSVEKAWVKTQNHISYEALVDRVELKLFEIDYDLEIERLIQVCYERMLSYLNVDFDIPYPFPKNSEVERPKSSARLEEQIVATALSLGFRVELSGNYPSVSFSHRLASDQSEFLYEYWFQSYNKYLSNIQKSLGEGQACTSDIKSFYTNISQSILMGILSHRLSVSRRSYEIIERIVRRDCHAEHKAGYGLLQGHAVSGLLANVVLQPVDDKLVDIHKLDGKYFRFADDVTFTGLRTTKPPEEIDEIVLFSKILEKQDPVLELNKQKTKKYESSDEFRKRIGGSKEFDDYSARFRKLLLPLFVMNREYRKEFSRINWHFVYEYQKLLEDIGIYFSPEWLYRKLDEYTRTKKLVTSQFKIAKGKYGVQFPKLSLNASRQGRLQWAKAFREENIEWLREKESLGAQLSTMFEVSARTLQNPDPGDLSWHTRRLKFSLYRLSVFGVGAVSSLISVLLTTQPWNIPIWLSCRGLARAGMSSELAHIISESKSSFVRANAAKALGFIRTPESIELLTVVLDGESAFIEKLMASEALLDANIWHDIQEEQVLTWLNSTKQFPYLYKNMILILNQAYPQKFFEYISTIRPGEIHPIVNRAIHYAKVKRPTENLLWRPEPEVIRKYRAKSYPIIEELLQDEGSYKFVSR